MKKLLTLVLLLVGIHSADAGLKEKMEEKWRWVKFGVQSGLPSDKNVKIVEAQDGTVWACTPKGFAWYDGYIWHKVPDGGFELQFSDINLAQPNHKSGLIAPCNGRLALITPDTIIIKKIIYNKKEVHIRETFVFDNRRLLLNISVANKEIGELFLYDGNNLKQLENTSSFKIYPNTEIYLYRDRMTNFWLNTDVGYYLYYNNKWELKKKNTLKEPFDLCKPIMNKTGKGFVAIGFPSEFKGVWNIANDKNELTFAHAYETSLYDGDMNNQGDVVTVHIGGFCEIYDKGEWMKLSEFPIEINNAIRVLFSSNDNLWISSEKGLYLCNLGSDRLKFIYDKKNDKKNFINEIIKVDNKYWFGSGYGVHITDTKDYDTCFNKVNGFEVKGVTGLIEDKYNNIWISSGSLFPSAYKWNKKIWQKVNIGYLPDSTFIHKIRKDLSGDLWFLTMSSQAQQTGFGAFQYKDGKFINWDTSIGLINNRVFDFIEHPKGTYWFATFGGLSRFENNKWTHWTTSNGLRFNRIYAIALDKDKNVWFTDYKYCIGYIENDSIHHNDVLDNADLLRAASIVFDDKNRLWIGTASGLYLMNKDAIANFNKDNGLLRTAIWPLLIEDDKVFIGTSGGGLNILSLKERDEPLPRVYIKFNGVTDGMYHISWDVFSYWGQIPTEDIQVRYKLDDKEWSNWCLLRELKLSKIGYGEHKFVIQAKGLFGDYAGTDKSIVFHVDYPFYFSPLFIIPILLFFSLAVGYRYNYNKKKRELLANTKKMNLELNQKVEKQTKQLGEALRDLKAEIMIRKQAEEELIMAKNKISKAYYKEKELNVLKSNTFSAISQEFKDPLTIISTSAELIEYYYAQNNLTGIKEKISNIKISTAHLFDIIEEIIIAGQFESNRIELVYEQFDAISLIKEIVNIYTQHYKKNHNIILDLEFEEFIIDSDKTFIKHIVTNLLSNAIKFSPDNSDITVEVKNINQKFTVKVKDNGVGIPYDVIDKIYEPFVRGENVKQIAGTGFGLTVVKRAVELLGGDILCSSVVNEGTIFSVYLPLDKKQI